MPELLIVGGNDRSLWANRGDLVAELLARGWEVHAALPPEESVRYEPLFPIPIHRIPMQRAGMNPVRDLECVRSLRQLVERLRPERVLAYNPKPVIFSGLALATHPEIRLVTMVTGRGALERRPGLKGAVAHRALSELYRRSLGRPDVLLFQNEDDRELFEERFKTQAIPVVEVLPGSGVNLERFPRTPLPEGPARFLLISKLLVDKGIREFVQAAQEVHNEVEGCAFRVVGGHDPGLPHALPKEEVERMREEGPVEFIGRVDDVRPHLEWCSVLCHPSYAEGTPRAVLEAMSTGRPVITSDAPGCRQTVDDGVSGYIVPVREWQAMAERMALLAREPRRRAGMGRKARERAAEIYDVRKVNARILHHLGLRA